MEELMQEDQIQEIRNRISDFLGDQLNEFGLSSSEFSTLAEIEESVVSEILNAEYEISESVLAKLGNGLGFTPGELLQELVGPIHEDDSQDEFKFVSLN